MEKVLETQGGVSYLIFRARKSIHPLEKRSSRRFARDAARNVFSEFPIYGRSQSAWTPAITIRDSGGAKGGIRDEDFELYYGNYMINTTSLWVPCLSRRACTPLPLFFFSLASNLRLFIAFSNSLASFSLFSFFAPSLPPLPS